MAQDWKVERVKVLKEELNKYSSYIFTDYRGLNVEQITSLRKSLREKGAEYHVTKNRFTKRAFQELKISGVDGFLINPTALAYTNEDISEISKILVDASGETTLTLKGGFSEGSILTGEEIIKISMLPSKQALIGQTVGLLNGPISGLAVVLNGVISKFLRTLKAVETTKN
jgi:large subunit ribosomal protein L10